MHIKPFGWIKYIQNSCFCCEYYQNLLTKFGDYNLKNDRLVKWGRVLEILIPKTIDKKVFMGYNVAIIFILFRLRIFDAYDEFLFIGKSDDKWTG